MIKFKKSFFKMLFLKIILYFILIIALISVFLYFFQSRLVFYPLPDIESTPADNGLKFEDIYILTQDGIRINAWYIPADGEKTILFCHGNAGNISHRLHSIMQFHDLRCNVLIFDYRGYGRSEGKISEEGTYLDGIAAYDYLLSSGISENNIIVFGRSLGGAVAAKIASQRSPAALILESTFTSIPDIGAKIYPFLPVRLLCRIKYNTLSIIDKVKCPVLVVHSPDDEIIPFEMGRKIFEAVKGPKEFLTIRGSHNEGYFISSPDYENGLRNFIESLR